MVNKLNFDEKMRLVFDDKDSLALKSLQDGVVDFSDKRIAVKGASVVDSKILGNNQQLLEVELGELKSLKENQVHIDELRSSGGTLGKGQQVVDDATIETQKYKLVMVGRAVSEDEEHHHMLDHAAQGQHILSTDVFHESGEKFNKNITKDEGILKHYMRHIYLLFGLIFGVTTVMKAY